MSYRYKPNHYIFESIGMANTAVHGRGINKKQVSVIYLGVDTEVFKPLEQNNFYAHNVFKIPKSCRIIYYSGHVDKRKGIDVLLKSAAYLKSIKNLNDLHFLNFGK